MRKIILVLAVFTLPLVAILAYHGYLAEWSKVPLLVPIDSPSTARGG